MDLLEILRNTGKECKDFKESKNYFYEYHICPQNGNNTKVEFIYILADEQKEERLRFGVCKACNTCYYHKYYKAGNL